MDIARTERLLDEAQGVREQERQLLDAEPDNIARELSLASVDAHIDELQHQLSEAKRQRDIEVMEIRLTGERAQNGTLPLDLLGALSGHVAGFLHSAASRIYTGKEPRGRIRDDVKDSLSLRFGGIAPGSTRLFITGKTSPDLLGRSLLEETLDHTFSLLADYSDESALMEHAHSLGNRGTHKLLKLVEGLQRNNLSASLAWRAPTDTSYEWLGTADTLESLVDSLKRISLRDTETITLDGVVHLIAMSGRLELHSDSGERVKADFPQSLLPHVKSLHVGDRVRGSFERTTIRNAATGDTKEYYTLQELSGHSRLPQT